MQFVENTFKHFDDLGKGGSQMAPQRQEDALKFNMNMRNPMREERRDEHQKKEGSEEGGARYRR